MTVCNGSKMTVKEKSFGLLTPVLEPRDGEELQLSFLTSIRK